MHSNHSLVQQTGTLKDVVPFALGLEHCVPDARTLLHMLNSCLHCNATSWLSVYVLGYNYHCKSESCTFLEAGAATTSVPVTATVV